MAKYIFDFDEVLLHTGKHWTIHTFSVLEKLGITKETIQEYYQKERLNLFSMRKLLKHLDVPEILYEDIMSEVKSFKNDGLMETISKLGKSNCYIVSYGDLEYQKDKIRRTGIEELFSEIIVVQDSKKEAIEKIALKHKDEKVFFIDDKAYNFDDLDLKKYPNLKTVLYTGQKLDFDKI